MNPDGHLEVPIEDYSAKAVFQPFVLENICYFIAVPEW
jgi:hypothetical protein